MKTLGLIVLAALALFFIPHLPGAKIWPIEAHCTGQPSVIMIPVPVPQQPGHGA